MATVTNNNDGGGALNDTDDIVTLTVIYTATNNSVTKVQALVRYKPPVYEPDSAIVTGGALTLGGSSTVSGSQGEIYATGDVTITGSASVSQDVYTAGDITGGDPAKNHPDSPAPEVPPISPSAYASLADYELRENGDVYSKTISAVIGNAATATTAGWNYTSGTKTWNNKNTPLNGTFYVVNGNIELVGNVGPWQATLLVNGTSTTTGKVFIKGTGSETTNMTPDEDSVAILAYNNIEIIGNFGCDGLVGTHEQISISGNASVNGSIVAESATRGVDGVSVVGSGNANVTYNGGMTTFISSGDEYIMIKGFKKLK